MRWPWTPPGPHFRGTSTDHVRLQPRSATAIHLPNKATCENMSLQPITRRRLLWSAVSGVVGVAYPLVIEPRWLDVTLTRVRLAASAGDIIRVLHLSDFHASWAVPIQMIDAAIQAGLSAKPDLICLTGDFITHRFDFDARAYVTALRQLAAAHP